MSGVAVVGSANLDLVYGVLRIPGPGETVLARSSSRNAGGKGQNQAVAAARAGAATVFIGALGDDGSGDALLRTMVEAQIDVGLVRRVSAPTGTAIIIVDDSAENSIVVDPGANAELLSLTAEELAAAASADVLLAQLEVPLATVVEAASTARAAGRTIILNAAPMGDLGSALLELVDVLVVNEHEVVQLARQMVGASLPLGEAIATVGGRVPHLVVTLGSAGVIVCRGSRRIAEIPAEPVIAVDTTGAGDTFCGALAAAICEGGDLVDAVHFASIAASISVERPGAVPSIPLRPEIEARRVHF